MNSVHTISHSRKRKRRRQDKIPISARLVTDDHVKGDVGVLSEDLWRDLFPQLHQGMLSPLVLVGCETDIVR